MAAAARRSSRSLRRPRRWIAGWSASEHRARSRSGDTASSAVSAAPPPGRQPNFPTPANPDPYYNPRPTNFYCAWGFGLGLAAPFLTLMTCGFGGLFAIPALLLSIVGLVQVSRNRTQSGQGLAVSGLFLSLLALLIMTCFFFWLGLPLIKAHGLTVTEQTSNDSE